MKCNIIGAGRLGKNIALSLSAHNLITLQSIINRTAQSAHRACQELGIGTVVEHVAELAPAELIWLSCSDEAIPLVVNHLLQNSVVKEGDFIIHCSGVHNSSLLAPLKAKGCSVASFHPLKAFKKGYLSTEAFHSVHCTIEGDNAACAWLSNAFSQLGARIFTLNANAKSAYHAAASMASNYLITLASCSESLFIEAGIPKTQARILMCSLMQGNVNNLLETEHIADTLTGPLVRGDEQTLNLHLEAIKNPVLQNVYRALGLATLELADFDPKKHQAIEELLN